MPDQFERFVLSEDENPRISELMQFESVKSMMR
jgi:hypothetical protein